jgi:hypothetical protein
METFQSRAPFFVDIPDTPFEVGDVVEADIV